MTKMFRGDVDIDVKNRDEILETLEYVPGTERINEDGYVPHKTGVYFDDIPTDPENGMASIPYKDAEAMGYQKVDFLNVRVYEKVRDRQHMRELLAKPVRWELFKEPDIVGELFQLANQFSIVNVWQPTNIHQLAMLIAMIRPAKRHLIACNTWEQVEKDIWTKAENGKMGFKKAHAYGYATAIIIQLNALVESLEQGLV